MDLSIIIVNWNSARYLGKCIESINRHTRDLNYEVIVVDNASFDGAREIIKKKFPKTIFIQSRENVGFARANNLGFMHSRGKYLLFLNPDTELVNPAINRMYSFLSSCPEAGAAGSRLLNSDLTLQTSCIQPFPTLINQVVDAEILKLKSPRLELWGIRPLFFNEGLPVAVEVISGACIVVKRTVFEKIGMFSTDYFMYTEDIDLCYKISLAGYKSYFVNDAQVIHHGGGSSRRREKSFNSVLMRESICIFLRKNRGTPNALLYRVMVMNVSVARLVMLLTIMPLYYFSGEKTELKNTLTKWKRILRWSLGLEKWARELSRRGYSLTMVEK